MYCVFCGAENPGFATFCQKCGKPCVWKKDQTYTEKEEPQAPFEAEPRGPDLSKFAPTQEQNGARIVLGDTGGRDYCNTYSEKTDAELLQLTKNMALLGESTRKSLKSELMKRGLGKASIEESKEEKASQLLKASKDVTSPKQYRGLWIVAWFIALLIYKVASHWSQNADKSALYIFLEALGRMTSPESLALSALVIGWILSTRRLKSPTAESQALKKQRISRPALRASSKLIGTAAIVIIIGLFVAWLPKGDTRQSGDQPVQARSQEEKTQEERNTANSNTLDNYEIMSKSKSALGTEDDGLSPETKKRMREMLALQMSGAMQKENNPIRIDVAGDNHDLFLIQLPSMNEEMANELIQGFSQGDANFWNGMRLMEYSQVVFSGDNYKRIVGKAEIIGYGKDYEKYKAATLKAMSQFQAGAQAEIKKP